jgi:hypothetical protein
MAEGLLDNLFGGGVSDPDQIIKISEIEKITDIKVTSTGVTRIISSGGKNDDSRIVTTEHISPNEYIAKLAKDIYHCRDLQRNTCKTSAQDAIYCAKQLYAMLVSNNLIKVKKINGRPTIVYE